ncbi:MAG: ComF family protein [Clostridiales bacterium]|nr:ComF family protein [Clostridiales bacterium]
MTPLQNARFSARQFILDLFFPWDNSCALCQRKLIGQEHVLCVYCEEKLKKCELQPLSAIKQHLPLCLCVGAYTYEDTAKELIFRLKYYNDATVALFLGQRMCFALLNSPLGLEWDAVVPVPLHPRKERLRGYNQSSLLASEIAGSLDIPMHAACLKKLKNTRSQTTKTREERFLAMKGVFTSCMNVQGMSILLVDDVLTTGATAISCAQALLDAGASRVGLLVACFA